MSDIIQQAFGDEPLNLSPLERDIEFSSYQMLAFASVLEPAPFSELLAAQGFYSKAFQEHSDKGLSAIENATPDSRSDELKAFHELERLGVYSQSDFFSPSKAKNGFYTERLKQHKTGNAEGSTGARGARQPPDQDRAREKLALPDEKQSRQLERRSRRKRL